MEGRESGVPPVYAWACESQRVRVTKCSRRGLAWKRGWVWRDSNLANHGEAAPVLVERRQGEVAVAVLRLRAARKLVLHPADAQPLAPTLLLEAAQHLQHARRAGFAMAAFAPDSLAPEWRGPGTTGSPAA